METESLLKRIFKRLEKEGMDDSGYYAYDIKKANTIIREEIDQFHADHLTNKYKNLLKTMDKLSELRESIGKI